jgi:Beta-lactamase superfamily domain
VTSSGSRRSTIPSRVRSAGQTSSSVSSSTASRWLTWATSVRRRFVRSNEYRSEPWNVLFVPVGAGPTIPAAGAAQLVREVEPRLVVAMHFRTELVGFLDPPDAFLEALGSPVERLPGNELVAEELLRSAPAVAVPAAPLA